MKKTGMRVTGFLLAILMMLTLMPYGSFLSYAKEGEEDNVQTEETEALGAGYKVGDIIKFGHYEQDGNTTNGKEEIEWEVLAIEGNTALVISKYVLDCQQYHTTWTDITWENCSIRKWLNSIFYNTAFTSSEQNLIPTVSLPNAEPWYDLSEGEYTQDKVFLLSVGELRKYYQFNTWDDDNHFGYCQKLVTEATSYAQSRGVFCYETSKDYYDDHLVKQGYTEDIIGKNGSIWWTRSVLDGQWACGIGWAGEGGAYCDCIENTGGVRPAMYITLKNDNPIQEYPATISYEYKHNGYDLAYATSFDPSILSKSSYGGYNQNLAEICAIQCQAIYRDQNSNEDKAIFDQMKFDGYKTVYDANFVYSIGYNNMNINGVDTNVVFLVLRGTKPGLEIVADYFGLKMIYFVGDNSYIIYQYSSEFGNKVKSAFNSLLKEHPELKKKPMKVVVTGHSLGGAAANLIGAEFTEDASEYPFSKQDVYVYTFGSIDTLAPLGFNSISEGYENIHNIYNFYDTFGPNGWILISAKGKSGYGKFGHIDLFAKNYGHFSTKNHMMVDTYLPAVFQNEVNHNINKRRVVGIFCPVDVNVYKDGVLIATIKDDTVDYESLGIAAEVVGDEKYFLIEDDSNYRFEIVSREEGTMEYHVMDAQTGNDSKEFQSVTLTPGKSMVSYVDSETETADIKLFTTDDSGKIVNEVTENGEEITASVQFIFKDVAKSAWYIPSIQYVYENNIMTGKGNLKFAPNASIKREEFTQILYSIDGKPERGRTDNPFEDVKDAWYKDSVLWAMDNSIVSGKSETRFGIGQNITREELALMLYKYARIHNFDVWIDPGKNLDGFKDGKKVSGWALEAVEWTVQRGIISGKGNATDGYRIDPQKGASRAECAAMITKFMQLYGGNLHLAVDDIEEPIALPMEETEELPLPEDETEDIIDDEEDQEEPEEIIDEEEKEDPEEQKEEIKEEQEAEEPEENSEEEK